MVSSATPPGARPKKSESVLEQLARGAFDFRQLAESALAAQGVPIEHAGRAIEGIVLYLQEVLRWGVRVDLIAPSSLEEFIDLSLADAALIARAELLRAPSAAVRHVMDVGSGGGAPGIPLAILLAATGRPYRFTFVEPRDKRVAFLRSVVGQLGLRSSEVLRTRSDQLPAHGADVALARATLPPSEWMVEGARLAHEVWVLVAKEAAPEAPEGWALVEDHTYLWPGTGRHRRALYYCRR